MNEQVAWIESKAFEIELNDSEEGTFTGLLSVYGNLDRVDDIVERGAFTKSISDNGNELVILVEHDTGKSIGIGTVEDTSAGLKLSGRLELDLAEAKQTYIRMKKRMMTGLSIGYTTKRVQYERREDKLIRKILEAELFEASVVVLPANPETRISSVKSVNELRELKTRLAEAEKKIAELSHEPLKRALADFHRTVCR